jgi:hypothetical protein
MNNAAPESCQPPASPVFHRFLICLCVFIGTLVIGWILIVAAQAWHRWQPKPKEDFYVLNFALVHFKAEYNQWPDEPSLAQSESIPVRVCGNLLQALLGTTRDNPRGIKFTEFRNASPGISGVTDEGETLALHDAWGTCYYLMADISGDSRIPNPEHFPDAIIEPKLKRRSPTSLPASSLLFSAGPDRDPRTWADNITS